MISCGCESVGQISVVEERREPGRVGHGQCVGVRGQIKIERVEDRGLVELRQDLRIGPPAVAMSRDMGVESTRRQHADRCDVVVQGQADLLEVVRALHAAGRFAAAWTAGKSRAINTAMMAITTRSSISVKADAFGRFA